MKKNILFYPTLSLLFFVSGCILAKDNQETKNNPITSQQINCQTDADCPLPMEYAIRSNCPFRAYCQQGECVIACPMWRDSQESDDSINYQVSCQADTDCDCRSWDTAGKWPCVCLSGQCASLVDDQKNNAASPTTPHPISIDAMIEKQYNGRELTLGNILAENEIYTRYYITYRSGDLKISGIMNVPKGEGPFPVLVLNHGYIDPAIYTNGRGLKREQDYLARQGYIVVHPDYRNHAQSDKDPDSELAFRLGYTEDVINVVYAIKNSELNFFDKENIGMLGHSMGGGITLNTLVIQPELIKAAVLFAPVSGDYRKNYDKWTKQRRDIATKVETLYGTPTTSPAFWDGISAINYLDRITAPIQIHHGTNDESVPLDWSNELETALKNESKSVVYFSYPNEPHEFANAWPTVMQRTTKFFDQFLK